MSLFSIVRYQICRNQFTIQTKVETPYTQDLWMLNAACKFSCTSTKNFTEHNFSGTRFSRYKKTQNFKLECLSSFLERFQFFPD